MPFSNSRFFNLLGYRTKFGPGPHRSRSHVGVLAVIVALCPGVAHAHPKYAAPPPQFFKVNQLGRPLNIEPGDVLAVRFYYNPKLDKTVKVRPDGQITLDLFQGIQVAGMTPDALHTKLEKMYSRQFRNPSITVDVKSAAQESIYITGDVMAPGAQQWYGNMTVEMALAMSHVNERTAGLRSVFLIRNDGAGKYKVYKLNASLPNGKSCNVIVAPGDILFVPRKFIAKADDFMQQYVRELLPATPTTAADVVFTPGNPVAATTASTTK